MHILDNQYIINCDTYKEMAMFIFVLCVRSWQPQFKQLFENGIIGFGYLQNQNEREIIEIEQISNNSYNHSLLLDEMYLHRQSHFKLPNVQHLNKTVGEELLNLYQSKSRVQSAEITPVPASAHGSQHSRKSTAKPENQVLIKYLFNFFISFIFLNTHKKHVMPQNECETVKQ